MNPKKLFQIACVFLGFAGLIWSQAETGQITGAVTDPSGAVIANAAVTVRNSATGATRETTSNSSGVYAVTNLLPGDYNITVTSSGFTTFKSEVSITVGAKVGVDVKLGVGEAVTVVEVNEVAAAVKTNSAPAQCALR